MRDELRKKILTFNREKAIDKEKAGDLEELLSALPPGQVKNLLKNERCAVILKKYGITGE